jgi:hypothetical protein
MVVLSVMAMVCAGELTAASETPRPSALGEKLPLLEPKVGVQFPEDVLDDQVPVLSNPAGQSLCGERYAKL